MADNDVKIKVSVDGADAAAKGLRGVGDGAGEADSKIGKLVGGELKGAGVALAGFAAAGLAAGAALTAGVVGAYATYEQNIGGIETLFGASAGKMEQYANEAYKTAGLSANEYMAQSTSFAAALLQGLGGDTEKAAEVANRAITDMSDNAAKFGSNISEIQNAYQGFAKQNFTMLDNLKLGYGGTASEMARLVNESGVLEGTFTATAENINSVSYDQIIAAIGAVQDKMGITGTTAAEASATISGSIDTLRGAYQNLLVGLGSADADVAKLAGNVIESFQQVVTNITPVIQNIGTNIATLGPQLGTMMQGLVGAISAAIPAVIGAGVGIIGGLISGISSALPGLITAIIPGLVDLVNTVATLAPQLIAAGAGALVALAQGVASAAPTLIPAIITGVLGMVQALIGAAPMILAAGVTLLGGLAEGVTTAIPLIVAALPGLIEGIVSFISGGVPQLLAAALTLFGALITALPQAIIQIIGVLPTLIVGIITTLLGAIPQLIQTGINLLLGLIGALPTIITTIVQAIPQIIVGIITAVLGAIPQLIAAGIELLVGLIGALPTIIVAIVGAVPQIIMGLVNALGGSIGQMVDSGYKLITSLVKNLGPIIKVIVAAIPPIISGLVSAVGVGASKLVSAGADLVRGIWEGISSMAGWLFNKVKGFVDGVVGNIADFFGIASPSTRMRDEVGKFLPSGIGVGVELNTDKALKPIQRLNSQIMEEAGKLDTNVAFKHEASFTQTLVPMKATPTAQGPISVEASLDSLAVSNAIAAGLAAADAPQEQAPVNLSRESVNRLATAIVDSMRVQSRQGLSVLG